MTTPLTRSFVSVTYLLGVRGNELSERVPEPIAQVEVGLLRGLGNPDRSVRTRFLAVAVRDLTAELRERELQPIEASGGES